MHLVVRSGGICRQTRGPFVPVVWLHCLTMSRPLRESDQLLRALRLDETAASCFGLDVARWKVTAFTLGNFLIERK